MPRKKKETATEAITEDVKEKTPTAEEAKEAPAAKKPAAKKTATRKAPVRKAAAAKTTTKTTKATKAADEKPVADEKPAKKAPAKAAEKSVATKPAAKKAPAKPRAKRTPVADKNGVAYAALHATDGDAPVSAGLPDWELRAFDGTDQRDGWVGVDPDRRVALTVAAAKKLDADGIAAIAESGLDAWKSEWWHDDYIEV